jgi:C4-type Zn-finger protein
MNAMLAILGGPIGGKSRFCPECESPMESNGTCSECGYGEEDMEEDEEEEGMDSERVAELRDDLQRIVDKMSKYCKPEAKEEQKYMLPLPTVYSVKK